MMPPPASLVASSAKVRVDLPEKVLTPAKTASAASTDTGSERARKLRSHKVISTRDEEGGQGEKA